MSDARKIGAAFRAGVAYATGRKTARRALANDAAQWITVHPAGKGQRADGKGSKGGTPVLIDDKTGRIIAGMGGRFNGRTMSDVRSRRTRAEERRARRAAKRKNSPASIDLENPARLDTSKVLQNRNRNSPGSVLQMKSIAANPDYDRLGVTKDFGSGAPVVAYGSIPKRQLGKITEAVMPDGQRYTVQYAVVDADKVLTSNNIEGASNPEYYSDDASKTRAIAGNGRLTGLAQAYKEGTADDYFDALADDPAHGISADVIDDMDAPVLVRIMQPKDVSADIGDRSNRQTGLSLGAVEEAKQDSQRIDFDKIKTYDDGTLTLQSLRDFVSQMPANERGSLLDDDGTPTARAAQRADAAVFHKAYNNDGLTRFRVQALEPEARNVLNALGAAAPAVAKLAGLPDGYDIRDIISQAAVRSVQALRKGQRLDEEAQQQGMFSSGDDDQAAAYIVDIFAKNRRSPKTVAEKLQKLSQTLYDEAKNHHEDDGFGSLFGGMVEQIPRNEVIKRALAADASAGKMSPLAREAWRQHGFKLFEFLFTR